MWVQEFVRGEPTHIFLSLFRCSLLIIFRGVEIFMAEPLLYGSPLYPPLKLINNSWNTNFLIHLSVKSNVINLRYFKLWSGRQRLLGFPSGCKEKKFEKWTLRKIICSFRLNLVFGYIFMCVCGGDSEYVKWIVRTSMNSKRSKLVFLIKKIGIWVFEISEQSLQIFRKFTRKVRK